MSDAGYDVWLGNYRGNTYSRAHLHLDPEELDFWQFRYPCYIPCLAMFLLKI